MAPTLKRTHTRRDYKTLSYWHDSLDRPLTPRRELDADLDCDVAIVGGGYTGLWTAYYLRQADRTLRVALLEREICGFGASGRNGGWCSGRLAASWDRIAKESGLSAATALRTAMQQTVDEVGRVSSAERIHCDFAKGGTIDVARSEVHLRRARSEVEQSRAAGLSEEDFRLVDANEASAILGAEGVLGGTYTPHCASIHPAHLARGLGEAVERHGVKVFEQTMVHRIDPGKLYCRGAAVSAPVIIRATEGYTARLPRRRREMAPLYSMMIATEPLSDMQWKDIGLSRRETFSDYRHLFVYGQRTADGRLAFGGRGAPYHFGSSIDDLFDKDVRVHRLLARSLVALFPSLRGVEITHRWGGPIGVPRDWYPSVGFDPQSGLGWAGGYVGYGVAAANLAGRTLADLVCRRTTELTQLPWVGHRSPLWEPEPLRFIGINAALRSMAAGDREEDRTGEPSRRAARYERLLQS